MGIAITIRGVQSNLLQQVKDGRWVVLKRDLTN